MKNLFVEYKCEKCGHTFKMCHGPIEELPDYWKTTTCMAEGNKCMEYENPKDAIDGRGHPKLPPKTAKMVKSWQE
jgi:rubredoxin